MMRCDNVRSLTLRKAAQWSVEGLRRCRKLGCPGSGSDGSHALGQERGEGRTVDELSALRQGWKRPHGKPQRAGHNHHSCGFVWGRIKRAQMEQNTGVGWRR